MADEDPKMLAKVKTIINAQKVFKTGKNVYGWLFYYKGSKDPIALKETSYVIKSRGKSPRTRIVISADDLSVPSQMFEDLDKHLFEVRREKERAYIHCLSDNSVWLERKLLKKGQKEERTYCELLKKDQKEELTHNAVISLKFPKQKLFVYIDKTETENLQLSQDIKDKFICSYSLGAGGFGEVFLLFEKSTSKKYALKKIQKKVNTLKYNEVELRILKTSKHPCIVHLKYSADTPDALYLVLEYMEGGDLDKRIKEKILTGAVMKESTTKLIFYQLVCAVDYLHKEGVAHRDLKPANILMSDEKEECLVKVTDFGISKVENDTKLRTPLGTQSFMAPEVFRAAVGRTYTNKVDIWSMGVILFLCLEGKLPFESPEKILNDKHVFGKYVLQYRKEAVDLVNKMLVKEAAKRIDTKDILSHSWLKDKEMRTKAEKLMGTGKENKALDNQKPDAKNIKPPLPSVKDKKSPVVKQQEAAKPQQVFSPSDRRVSSPPVQTPSPLAQKMAQERHKFFNETPKGNSPAGRRYSNPVRTPSSPALNAPQEKNKFFNETQPGIPRGFQRFGSYKEGLAKRRSLEVQEAVPTTHHREQKESFHRAVAMPLLQNVGANRGMIAQPTQPAHGIVEQRKHIFEK